MYQLILCSAKGIVIPVYSGGFRFWFPFDWWLIHWLSLWSLMINRGWFSLWWWLLMVNWCLDSRRRNKPGLLVVDRFGRIWFQFWFKRFKL